MNPDPDPTLWWVRRDLRLTDNPALLAAAVGGAAVLPLFVLDPVLLRSAEGTGRRRWLMAALRRLDEDLRAGGGPGLSVVEGRPAEVVPRVAGQVGAREVHVTADFGPYGRRRDTAVERALASTGRSLRATGSPYGVAPGMITKGDGTPFQVFSPYHRAWLAHGVHPPAPTLDVGATSWLAAPERTTAEDPDPDLLEVAGEAATTRKWHAWLDRESDGVSDYAKLRNLPAADATSRLSKALRWGHLHPRTVLADVAARQSKGAAALAREISWRDFFADVLWHRPDAVTVPVKTEFRRMTYDDVSDPAIAARLAAWQSGRTGYPLVDAGMRQLVAEGWMHNRLRMVVASFLIKDLHIEWTHGGQWFMDQLHDGDVANNQLNWQWVAGCGTDPAPFFRVFNPTGQAEKFDPDGAYIRRWLPELADVSTKHIFEPGTDPAGLPADYPPPIVDHAAERKEALARYERMRETDPETR